MNVVFEEILVLDDKTNQKTKPDTNFLQEKNND